MKVPCDSVQYYKEWNETLNERLSESEAERVRETFFSWVFSGIDDDYDNLSDHEYYAFRYLQSEFEAL